MKKTILTLAFALATTLTSAFALDLDTARTKKMVTELPSGYLKANSDEAKSLVDGVNSKRKQHYSDIAKKNGIPVDQVAEQAAKKIEEKLKGN
jgi:uncharacterized protein YdbL (DUF1318 family)